jgi:hypothetical protein
MLILTFIFSFFMVVLSAPPNQVIYIQRVEPVKDLQILSWSNIDFYISKFDIKEPKIVKIQIRHETGNLKSKLCLQQNNLLGMRFAPHRETTAIGEGNHHARYQSWQKSLEDYKIWQSKYYHEGDYYQFLENIGYATDPWYIHKLRKIEKQIDNEQ